MTADIGTGKQRSDLAARAGLAGMAGLIMGLFPVCASASDAATASLKQLSVEDLMNVEVYSASRHLEPTQTSPNAIYVLTAEDIRRSHATTIPEALRLVPGVQVGRVDANKWAVSMRGFNSREANKLLVLIDGRSVYDHLFSGTLWESQDVMLEDVERIEVVRGPGGTLWGANAVNGIINVVTRKASDTQGALVSVTAGTEENYVAAGRFGWQPSARQFARVYAKAYDRDTGFSSLAAPHDASDMARAGFRWEWGDGARDYLRVSGDVFDADTGIREDRTLVQDVVHQGKNLLARWERSYSPSSSFHVQTYYDEVDLESFGFSQHRAIHDIEVQQSTLVAERHQLVAGAGYRTMRDRTASGLSGFVDVLPLRRQDDVSTLYLQDIFAIRPDLLALTLGVKYEDTDYASAEWLPSARLAWTPTTTQTWWAAVADATRVPSRIESDLTFFGSLRLGGAFHAEHVRAFELGNRQLLSSRFWYDVTLYYHDYEDLRTTEAGGTLANLMHGHSKGIEIGTRWDITDRWRLDGSYTYLEMNLGLDPGSTSNRGQTQYIADLAPRHQAAIRSGWDITGEVELDLTLRYVDELPTLRFDDYTELDAGLTWGLRPGLSLSLVGLNLLDAHHPEQAFAFSASGMYTEVERSGYGKLTWEFR